MTTQLEYSLCKVSFWKHFQKISWLDPDWQIKGSFNTCKFKAKPSYGSLLMIYIPR